MNKRDLVKAVGDETGCPQRQVALIVDAVFSLIRKEMVSGNEVVLAGFGVFKTVARKPRVGYNPKTGDKISIPERRVAVFHPSRSLKESVAETACVED